jgi:hypothetical protein
MRNMVSKDIVVDIGPYEILDGKGSTCHSYGVKTSRCSLLYKHLTPPE